MLDVGVRCLGAAFEGLGIWLSRLHAVYFIALVSVVAIVRWGFAWHGTGTVENSANVFPLPYDYSSTGLLVTFTYKFLAPSTALYALLSVIFTVALVIIPTLISWRRSPESNVWRLTLLIFCCWQAPALNLQFLGHYQVLFPLMCLCSILLSRAWICITFAFLAVLSNPEQATLAYLMLALLTFVPEFRQWRRVAISGLCIGAATTIAGSLWLAANGLPSRLTYLEANLQYSIVQTVKGATLGLYSWWGPWWILILIIGVTYLGDRRSLLILGTVFVFLPGIATATTADGTRVFVSVATCVGIAASAVYLGLARGNSDAAPLPSPTTLPVIRWSMALWASALLLLPVVRTDAGNTTFVMPWSIGVNLITQQLQ